MSSRHLSKRIGTLKAKAQRRDRERLKARKMHLESLEDRRLMAVAPKLAAILPNSGVLLNEGDIRNVAPKDLTFRFVEGQGIDPATLAGIRVTRSGFDGDFENFGAPDYNDVIITPGFIGLGDNDREVVMRFAETLPDDVYRIEIFGADVDEPIGPDRVALRDTAGTAFNDGIDFRRTITLDLGAQIIAVVPQPVTRGVGGALTQARNQIVVYFNNDDLNVASAQNPNFYKLIATRNTLQPLDDLTFTPMSVVYNPATDSAVLTFAGNLDQLVPAVAGDPDPARSFRLRIGTNESIVPSSTAQSLPSDPGSSFSTATSVPISLQTGVPVHVTDAISAQPYDLMWPGINAEPGHRHIEVEDHLQNGPDSEDGITTVFFNFRSDIGEIPDGIGGLQPAFNLITEIQKQRAREIFELISRYSGIQFIESVNQGITVATGDMRAIRNQVFTGGGHPLGNADPPIDPTNPNNPTDISGRFTRAIMDNAEVWNDQYGGNWFQEAMQQIGRVLGLDYSFDLPPITVNGSDPSLQFTSPAAEPVFPGDHDIVHYRHLFRPEGKDIDMYRFTLDRTGVYRATTMAERLADSSSLDTQLRLYKVDLLTGKPVLIAQNDDYFSKDSLIELTLDVGTYFLGVSAKGNDQYDPTIVDSGIGGTTQGPYQLKMDFRPAATTSIVDDTGTSFDGDADGVPGGVYNFWFRAAAPRLAGSRPANDVARTLFVDKESASGGNGALATPFNNIATALAAARAHDIVRIVGNDGADNNPATLNDNLAYRIGFDVFNDPLADGTSLSVPKDVTVMIDSGAIFQLRKSQIVAGSTSPAVASDRSGGALQVVGTPTQSVFFTSYNEHGPNSLGLDQNPLTTTPAAGDWGGISFKSDLDRADGRFLHEEVGVFLNYVNHADIRFGGGAVVVDSVSQVITPIHMTDNRPTISFNTITRSSDAAMSANPDSFEETDFSAPKYFRSFNTAWNFDYRRIGPDIHGNLILNNTTNGLFVRTRTPAGNQIEELTVAGRFDDTDIVHVIQENLSVRGTPGGPTLETIPPPIILVVMTVINPTVSNPNPGFLRAGDQVEYRMTYVDLLGNEGLASDASLPVNITQNNSAVQFNNLPVPTGEFVARRIYRRLLNVPGSEYEFVGQVPASRTTFVDNAPRNDSSTINRDRLMVATTNVPVPQFVNPPNTTELPGGGAGFAIGTQLSYQFSYLDSQRRETVLSNIVQHTVSANDRNVQVTGIPAASGNYSIVRIYRDINGGGFVPLVELPADFASVIVDTPALPTSALLRVAVDAPTPFMTRPRLDGSLVIDPSLIVKSDGARIEVGVGANLIAEGIDGLEIVFTSLSDDRYGAGGTFDTRNDNNQATPRDPARGDWGGLFFSADSSGSIDQAVIAYGGGLSRVEGTFAGFNAIEIHQGDVRVAHVEFEQNGIGAGGQSQADRFGRGFNADGTIFVRGAQPVVISNIVHDNDGPLVNINVNALNHETVVDWGRSRNLVDRMPGHFDNNGPLIDENRLVDNTVNGIIVRGGTVTTEVVMDDTDIAHGLRDAITVPDFHTFGGLRLESQPTESLVIKSTGGTAGIVATGRPLEIDDRIGGSIQVVGQPGFPVILTSFSDDTASAGFTPKGDPQGDTNGDGPSGGSNGGIIFPPATGELLVTYNTNAVQLVNAMTFRPLPTGVTIPGATYLGHGEAAGTYINGDEVALEIAPRGIILSSGDVNLPVTNTLPDFSQSNGQAGDADLEALIGGTVTRDAAILTITIQVDPASDIKSGAFDFQFGSEEFSEFVGTPFNDVLGGFINGGASTNFIQDSQGNLVTINSGFFDIDNEINPTFDVEWDGMTSGLVATFPLQKGTNTLKIAIADATDSILDSGVFITDLRFSTDDVGSGGVGRVPVPGEWQGILVDRFASDRNVQDVVEFEQPNAAAPGANAVPETAQFLGGLAPFEKGGDENLRLGYTIHGLLNAPNDVDVYSFEAKAGTEVWFDIDRTSHALDAVVELVDDQGNVLARSDNSPAESAGAESLFGGALRMQKTPPFTGLDHYTTNPRDPGMRVILPGPANTINTYHVRVRSSSPNLDDTTAGLTRGTYQLQLRLREEDEIAGTAIVFSDIRYAASGITILGQPTHSPLAGEHFETGGANDTFGQSQQMGNLLNSDRGTLAVGGALASRTDVDWYRFTVDYDAIQRVFELEEDPSPERWFSTIFDIDYADGFSRPNTILNVYNAAGQLVLSSRDSNVADDRPRPLNGADVSDLNRGSSGAADPFIGSTELPEGNYFLAISSDALMPAELGQYFQATPVNPLFRLEPVNSVRRIVEDHIDFNGGGTAEPPQVPVFIDTTSQVPWHLGDLALFIGREDRFPGAAPKQSSIRTVDPFTGEIETVVGTFGQDIGDIDFRNDFQFLYSYTLDHNGAVEDAQSGNFLQIDTGNGAATNLGDDGILTFEGIPANVLRAHLVGTVRIGYGIQFDAHAFGDVFRDGLLNEQILVAVGHRGELDINPNINTNIPTRENAVFLMNINTGAGRGANVGARVSGTGTDILEMGEILTAPTLTVPEATEAPAPGAPDAIRNIKDGDILIVDDGQTQTFFEFEGGPEILQDVNPATGRFVDDGYFFTLDPDTNVRSGDEFLIQFDTGTGIEIVATSNFPDGNPYPNAGTIAITGAPGTSGVSNVVTFELSTDNVLNTPGAILVNISPLLPPNGIAGRLVTAINAQTSAANWPVTATLVGGRIALRNNTGVQITDNLAGLVVLNGSTGKAPILQAVPGSAITDGQFFDMRVYTTTGNSSTTYRFEFNSAGGLTAATPPGGFLVGIPFTAGDTAAQIASAIHSAMENASPLFQASLAVDRVLANASGISLAGNGYNQQTSPIVDLTTPAALQFRTIVSEEDNTDVQIGALVNTLVNGVTLPFSASFDFDRINFPPIVTNIPVPKGPVFEIDVTGMFDRFVNVLGSETGVSPGNEPIIFEADDTAADMATKIASAIDRALLATAGIDATASGANVRLNFGTVLVDTPPFSFVGEGPGGRITGLANIRGTLETDPVDGGGRLYAVSDQGGLYRVTLNSFLHLVSPSNFTVTTDYIESSENDLRGIRFQGLTSGPVLVEGGRYQNFLFGLDNNGRVYCFDTNGILQPVFANGTTFIDTGIADARGLAFSNLEANLWNNSGSRGVDPGHGINPTFDDNRIGTSLGGNSITFGRGQGATYFAPGGAHGTVVSNEFSLEGYSPADQPTLYFNYFADTENAGGPQGSMRDAYRVFVSSDNGDWQLLATNNSFRGAGGFDDEFDYGPPNGTEPNVQELFDTDNWRQVRIDLSSFAGQKNLRLRFDASTAASMNLGDAETTGDELRVVRGGQILDGDTFVTRNADGSTDTFEFELDYALQFPSAPAVEEGLTFTLNANPFVTVTTLNDGEIGQNEVQQLAYPPQANPTGGTFRIRVDTPSGIQVTDPIPFNATAVQIRNALTSLRTSFTPPLPAIFNPGDVIVTGGPLHTSPIRVEFSGQNFNQNVEPLSIDPLGLLGTYSRTFEYTRDGAFGAGNEPIEINNLMSSADVASQTAAVVGQTVLSVGVHQLNDNHVQFDRSTNLAITATSAVRRVVHGFTIEVVSVPTDGQRFVINDGRHAAQTFEYDTNGVVAAGSARIDIAGVTLLSTIASRTFQVINTILPDAVPRYTSGAKVNLLSAQSLTVTNAAALRRTTHGFNLEFRNVPADGATFTINDGQNPLRTFEFDNNNVFNLNNTRVGITGLTTGAQVASAAFAAINQSVGQGGRPAAAPRLVDGINLSLLGVISLPVSSDSAAVFPTANATNGGVLPGNEAIEVHRGMNREEVSVQVDGVLEPFYYNRAIITAPSNTLVDGDTFTIDNGIDGPVTFEFQTGFVVRVPAGGTGVADTDTITLSTDANRVTVRTVQNGVPGIRNEIQELELHGLVTGGTFTLTVLGQTTAPIAFNASPAQIQTAIENLGAVAVGEVVVTGSPQLTQGPARIEFVRGLGQTNQVLSTANGALLNGTFTLVYEFDKNSSVFTPGAIPVRVTDNFSHLAVAIALSQAIQTTAPNVKQAFGLNLWNGRVLSGNRVQLGGTQGMTITFNDPLNYSVVGSPNVGDGNVPVHVAISTSFRSSDVAQAIANAINASPLAPNTTAGVGTAGGADQRRVELFGADEVVITGLPVGFSLESSFQGDVVKTNKDLIRFITRDVAERGPMGVDTVLEGDVFGAFNSNVRGQNNNFEGVYFDDIIIGFAERGEIGTGSAGNTGFVNNPLADPLNVANGPYQLEIRRGTDFGVPDGALLDLVRSFDPNDRLTQELVLVAPPGASIRDGQTFTLSDGVNSVTFEFNDLSLTSNAIVQGHVRVDFRSFWTDDEMARAIRQTINSTEVQAVLNVQASLSDGALVGQSSTDNVLNLFGAVTVNLEGDEAREINDTTATAVPAAIFLSRYTANGTIGDNPVLSTDRLTQPLDVDLFAIDLVAGRTYGMSVDALSLGSTLDPVLRLFDALGIELAISFNDPAPGKQSRSDSFISFTPSISGTYFIGVSGEGNVIYDPITGADVAPGDMGFYVLNVTDNFSPGGGPDLNAVKAPEPNETDATAVAVDFARATITYDGFIGDNPAKDPDLDRDVYVINPNVGETIRINVDAQSIGSTLDPVLRIFNSLGAQVRIANNVPAPGKNAPLDSFIQFTRLPADGPGPFYVGVSGAGNAGYNLQNSVGTDTPGSIGPYRITFTRTGFGISENPFIVANEEFGDKNLFRDQGQVLLIGNRVSNSANWGILVDSGARTPADGNTPHQGPVRNLRELNVNQLVPGVVIMNNIIFDNAVGGIRFSGDAGGEAPIPFGRIINNTLFGVGGSLIPGSQNDVGIQVDERAGPTMLNNVLANFSRGIDVDATSQPNTVMGGTLFQGNLANSNAGLGDFPILLTNSDPLFVNADNRNFYPKAQSPVIDSSVDSLLDRPSLVTVRNPLGIPVSNVLAPERDNVGQKRLDDPDVETPLGQGENVTKDRGALDRVDFTGPISRILIPEDNDSLGLDLDLTETVIVLSNQVLTSFTIQLIDAFDPLAPPEGSGIDDTTILSRTVVVEATFGSTTTTLVEGVDYSFSYDQTNNLIRLNPLGGLWPLSRTYKITLDNDPIGDPSPGNGIRDLAGNVLLPNQIDGTHIYTIFLGSAVDFGDAPDPTYPTLAANNGASHQLVGDFFLGGTINADTDGQPSPNADRDTSDDGVTFVTPLITGDDAQIIVNSSATAILDAWIDLNLDGTWDASEKIISGFNLVEGDNPITLPIPLGPRGPSFARFRMSSTGLADPTGAAADGEVEDYKVALVGPPFQNQINNLDVNNDFKVSPIDALLVINALNRFAAIAQPGEVFTVPHPILAPSAPPYLDVNGSNTVTPIDALLVINFLNANAGPQGEGEADEGAISAASTTGGSQVPSVLYASSSVVVETKSTSGAALSRGEVDDLLFSADNVEFTEPALPPASVYSPDIEDDLDAVRNKSWDEAIEEFAFDPGMD